MAYDGNLADSLHHLAGAFRASSPITIDVELDADLTGADDAVAVAIFQIAQEALANVRKHSQAKHVRVAAAPDGRCRSWRASPTTASGSMPRQSARRNIGGCETSASRATSVGGSAGDRKRGRARDDRSHLRAGRVDDRLPKAVAYTRPRGSIDGQHTNHDCR